MNNSNSIAQESIAEINREFSSYLRSLQKKKMHFTIFRLTTSFITILRTFCLASGEYEYFFEKYKDSKKNESDLSNNEIKYYIGDVIKKMDIYINYCEDLPDEKEIIAAKLSNEAIKFTRSIQLKQILKDLEKYDFSIIVEPIKSDVIYKNIDSI